MNYLVLKAFHLIFVVCWFAGLFYLGRLFIYFKEAESRNSSEKIILQDQYLIMAKRLMNIIIWPSVLLTSVFGWYMIFLNFNLLDNAWMQVKLLMVFFLILYVIICQIVLNQMSSGTILVSDSTNTGVPCSGMEKLLGVMNMSSDLTISDTTGGLKMTFIVTNNGMSVMANGEEGPPTDLIMDSGPFSVTFETF